MQCDHKSRQGVVHVTAHLATDYCMCCKERNDGEDCSEPSTQDNTEFIPKFSPLHPPVFHYLCAPKIRIVFVAFPGESHSCFTSTHTFKFTLQYITHSHLVVYIAYIHTGVHHSVKHGVHLKMLSSKVRVESYSLPPHSFACFAKTHSVPF